MSHDPPDDVIIESMALPLLVLDAGCRIVRFNRPAERLTGFYRSKVLGLSCSSVLEPRPCDQRCPVWRVLHNGTSVQSGQMTLRAADQHEVRVEAIASPLLGPRERVIGAVQILRESVDSPRIDVSLPARRARQEIETIREALERSGGNLSKAARALQVHRTTLWRKIKRFGIDH